MLLGNFYCCKWPNIEQIVYPSGHTVLYHHHHELCNGCEREIRRRNRKTWMTSSSQFIYLEANLFLKKGPFSASFFFTFVLFTFQFKWQIYSLNNINWKKHRWCAWDSNLGKQDGRCKRIHWAMAAPSCCHCYISQKCSYSFYISSNNFCIFVCGRRPKT